MSCFLTEMHQTIKHAVRDDTFGDELDGFLSVQIPLLLYTTCNMYITCMKLRKNVYTNLNSERHMPCLPNTNV